MTFAREREMARPVRSWLMSQGLQVKQEYSTPWGICDFVAASLNRTLVRKRLELRQSNAIGSLFRLALLQRIPDSRSGRSISWSRLEHLCRVPSEYLEAELDKLIVNRFVIRTPRGAFQKLNGWQPLHKKIIAIELKLNRVAEAIMQARANRAFATESFIALPAETAYRLARSERKHELTMAGVGIIAVSRESCTVLLRPSDCGIAADPVLQMHCVERFWRTRDN